MTGTYWYILRAEQREACFVLAERAPPPHEALRRRMSALCAPTIAPDTNCDAALDSALEAHVRAVLREVSDATVDFPSPLKPHVVRPRTDDDWDEEPSVYALWVGDDGERTVRMAFVDETRRTAYVDVFACCAIAMLLFLVYSTMLLQR